MVAYLVVGAVKQLCLPWQPLYAGAQHEKRGFHVVLFEQGEYLIRVFAGAVVEGEGQAPDGAGRIFADRDRDLGGYGSTGVRESDPGPAGTQAVEHPVHIHAHAFVLHAFGGTRGQGLTVVAVKLDLHALVLLYAHAAFGGVNRLYVLVYPDLALAAQLARGQGDHATAGRQGRHATFRVHRGDLRVAGRIAHVQYQAGGGIEHGGEIYALAARGQHVQVLGEADVFGLLRHVHFAGRFEPVERHHAHHGAAVAHGA